MAFSSLVLACYFGTCREPVARRFCNRPTCFASSVFHVVLVFEALQALYSILKT